MMTKKKLLFPTSFLLFILLFQCQAETTNDKMNRLTLLITDAKTQNIDVTRDEMTLRMAQLFITWAEWDDNNQEINTAFYLKHPEYKDNAAWYAKNLPDFQRDSIDMILDQVIAELTALNNGEIKRKPVPNIAFDEVVVGDEHFLINNTPVYLNTYTWKPDDPLTNPYFGNLNSQFISPNFIQDSSGTINQNRYNAINNDNDNRIGQVFISHSGIPDWATTEYENFSTGSRLFSKYDIDHPKARALFSTLFASFIPALKDKRSSDLGYMLFNEPSFFTQADVWNTGEVSSFTKDKFKIWLQEKHVNIETLNVLWLSSFTSFQEIDVTIPMAENLKGTAIWFDWMRFNQIRVVEWFTFLNSEIKKHDPSGKTHIKLMPWLWNESKRDHGLDFESLLNLTDIIGFDANSEYRNLRKTSSYESEYSFDWQSAIMSFDFFSSVQPEQILWDSENHFFNKGSFQEHDIDPTYINAIYWLATNHGLSGSSTWLWGRNIDGSIISSRGINSEYITEVTHQPIGFHQLTRTIMDINANMADNVKLQKLAKPIRLFYSETSAINQTDYMDSIRLVYKKLFFDGVPLGFATQKIINTQNNNWPIMVINDTVQVTTDELTASKQFIDNYGTVFIDSTSLKLDEYGRSHPASLLPSDEQVIRYKDIDDLRAKVNIVKAEQAMLPAIEVVETGNQNNKKVAWRVAQKSESNYVLSLINTGKENVNVALSSALAHSAVTFKITHTTNLLNGKNINNPILLAPKEHYFLEVQVEEIKPLPTEPDAPIIVTPEPAPSQTIELPNTELPANDDVPKTKNSSGGSLSWILLLLIFYPRVISKVKYTRALSSIC